MWVSFVRTYEPTNETHITAVFVSWGQQSDQECGGWLHPALLKAHHFVPLCHRGCAAGPKHGHPMGLVVRQAIVTGTVCICGLARCKVLVANRRSVHLRPCQIQRACGQQAQCACMHACQVQSALWAAGSLCIHRCHMPSARCQLHWLPAPETEDIAGQEACCQMPGSLCTEARHTSYTFFYVFCKKLWYGH